MPLEDKILLLRYNIQICCKTFEAQKSRSESDALSTTAVHEEPHSSPYVQIKCIYKPRLRAISYQSAKARLRPVLGRCPV